MKIEGIQACTRWEDSTPPGYLGLINSWHQKTKQSINESCLFLEVEPEVELLIAIKIYKKLPSCYSNTTFLLTSNQFVT